MVISTFSVWIRVGPSRIIFHWVEMMRFWVRHRRERNEYISEVPVRSVNSAFEGDILRWGLGRGGEILKCKSPWVSVRTEQLSEHMNLSWALFQVPCTYHTTWRLRSYYPGQSGNGHIGSHLSYSSPFWHKQLKGQEIYFGSWLEVCPTCNPWATCRHVWVGSGEPWRQPDTNSWTYSSKARWGWVRGLSG